MDKMIRVLQVVTTMNGGGLESMIMNYYRNIDRTKIQFDFLMHRPESELKGYTDEIKILGGKIYTLPRLNPFSLSYLSKLNAFFKEHKEYSVVHVHQDCLSGIILKAAKRNGVKVRIAHCHSSNQDKNLKYIIKYLFRHNIKKYATKLLACGYIPGKWMFCTDNFEILHNAIDTEKFRYDKDIRSCVRKDLGINDSFVIGHVGRFSKVKNHLFLVRIFEEILNFEKSSKLVFVGTGEEESNIKNYVTINNLTDKITFLGPRQDVERILQAIDVFILPSKYEGVSVAEIEAQAAGLPCVVSDKVPEECDLTGNVVSVSLKEDLSTWAQTILRYKEFERKDTSEKIKMNRYDIKENVNKLMNYYLDSYYDS